MSVLEKTREKLDLAAVEILYTVGQPPSKDNLHKDCHCSRDTFEYFLQTAISTHTSTRVL